MTKQKIISIIKYAAGVLLGILLLFLAFRGISWQETLEDLQSIQIGWIILSLFVALISHFLRALRWKMQLTASGYPTHLGNTYAAVLITYLVNLALPRAGELARCSALYKSDQVPLSTSFGTVLVERVIDLIILLGLICLAFLLEYDTILHFFTGIVFSEGAPQATIPIWLWAVAILGLVALTVAYYAREKLMSLTITKKIIQFGFSLLKAASDIQKVKSPTLFVIYTILIWVCYGLMTYLAFFSMPEIMRLNIDLAYLALIVTVMGGIGMAMPVPGGTGPYHVAVEYTFAALMVLPSIEASKQLGLSFAIILHSAQVFLMIAAGLVAYIYLWYTKSPYKSEENS